MECMRSCCWKKLPRQSLFFDAIFPATGFTISSTCLGIKFPLSPRLNLILDHDKSFLADVCQQKRHAKCDHDVRNEKEDHLFERQNPKEQNSCGLSWGNRPCRFLQ